MTIRLINEGFLFSVGESINIDSLQMIPIDSLFCETDEGEMSIRDVYLQASQAINMDREEFALRIAENVRRVFPSVKPPKPYFPEEEEED